MSTSPRLRNQSKCSNKEGDAHVEPISEKIMEDVVSESEGSVSSSWRVDDMLHSIFSSVLCQCCVIFPIVALLCYIIGFFQIWVAVMATGLYYVVTIHKRDRERFHRSYLWTLQTLIDKREEIPRINTHHELSRGIGGAGETFVLENLATIWWKTNARSVFQTSILEKTVDSLNTSIASNNSMIESFVAGRVKISSRAPKLLSVQSQQSSYNSLYQDMKWEYHGDSSLPFSVIFAGTKIPIEITDIKFMGTIRLETIFPHSEYIDGVECKEQESFTMAVSIIDKYLLDFEIVASSFNLASIPTLRTWIQSTIYDNIQQIAIWPNQIRLFGPGDHLYKEDSSLSSNNELKYAMPIVIPTESNPEASKTKFICAITLFFPDGENSSPPEGFELIDRTCTGNYAANLCSGSTDQRAVYLCVKKSTEGMPLTGLGTIKKSKLEELPEDYRLIIATHFGEDAYITEHTKGDEFSRVYFCYEKGPRTKGIISDVRVLFDEELTKIRELKLRNQTQGLDEFPVGYTSIKINTVQQANGKQKNVFLCLKRIGGTTLQSFAPETKRELVPSKSSSILNKLQTITTTAVKDVKEIHRTKKEKSLKEIGITPAVIESVTYLSNHLDIFQQFPLDGHQPKEDFFMMNEVQQKHAIQVLKAVPKLGETRRQLAPSLMSDSSFWFVYFSFMKKTNEERVTNWNVEYR